MTNKEHTRFEYENEEVLDTVHCDLDAGGCDSPMSVLKTITTTVSVSMTPVEVNPVEVSREHIHQEFLETLKEKLPLNLIADLDRVKAIGKPFVFEGEQPAFIVKLADDAPYTNAFFSKLQQFADESCNIQIHKKAEW